MAVTPLVLARETHTGVDDLVRDGVDDAHESLAHELEEGRKWRRAEYGDDVEVSLRVEK